MFFAEGGAKPCVYIVTPLELAWGLAYTSSFSKPFNPQITTSSHVRRSVFVLSYVKKKVHSAHYSVGEQQLTKLTTG